MLLKPDFDIPDPIFKEDACQFIASLGEVVATFDNEPGNCNIFQGRWPNPTNVFLNTQRVSMEELPTAEVLHLDDFVF